MTIKTFFLASAAATVLTAAPALAQEAQQPAADPASASAAQPSLSLTPGATVRGPDGDLGTLEGVRTNAEGRQELTVRGGDGQLRGVPLAGIRQDGQAVAVAYTKAEFDAAAPIADTTAAPAAAEPTDPAAAPTSDDTATPPASDPATTTPPTGAPPPPLPTDPVTEPTTEPTEPATPPTQPN
ncbi:hypothetical protein [Brevundimonas sp. SORGH_AS_0993]|uniref:hypothetical protein n=1 Tax=Brevundimonas sp. SORGH_AS_0993 TaxID=3041794 RepID=UPI00278A27D7|nr:hypothetical protein [Brevundimonas sp. SORGH_AS_0993]MDQ1154681.1 hypothetical protein [Brevundimonas sp. SORGH_AS_0993]